MMKAMIGLVGIVSSIAFWLWMIGLGIYLFWVGEPSMHMLGVGLGTLLLSSATDTKKD